MHAHDENGTHCMYHEHRTSFPMIVYTILNIEI